MNELADATRVKTFLDRGINEGLSGGEIRRAELMQLMAQNPVFSMLDEPDSGLDMESIAPLGRLINSLFSPDPEHPVKRRAGLIITHNGDILNYMNADKAHIMIDGNLCCSGNPGMILETVSKSGFEECARCMRERQ
jgi:Fe-S cluster assembly ATP-binding protein